MSTPAKSPLHLPFLDGLRALAAVYVMIHHAWLTVWPDSHSPAFVYGFPLSPLAFGHQAVTVFIVLSGFCLMLPVVRAGGELRGGAPGFFKRRLRRIIPPYYFAILLSCILLATLIGGQPHTIWGTSVPHGKTAWIKGLATHFLLVDDFFDAGKINYVFWSVAVEWQIYFLFPLLLLLWRRINPLATTLAMLFLAFAMAAIFHSERLRQVRLHYAGLFALGMLAAQIAFGESGFLARARTRVPWRLVGITALIAIAALIARAGLFPHWNAILFLDFLVALATTSIILVCCQPGNVPTKFILSAAPIVWVGTFSYSLYLIHAPLLELIWRYTLAPLNLNNGQSFLLLAFPGGALIILLSYLFYLTCERPFLNRPPQPSSPSST